VTPGGSCRKKDYGFLYGGLGDLQTNGNPLNLLEVKGLVKRLSILGLPSCTFFVNALLLRVEAASVEEYGVVRKAGANGALGRVKRVTLEDIAKIVGVSRATVSLALNGKGTLPERRRDEIKRVAAELNYIPNPLAQALRGVRTHSIGVVTNYFSNIYFRDFYVGLEGAADTQGFSFMVSQAYESIEKEKQQVARFSEYGVDGLIVLPCSQENEHLLRVSALGIPVVLISNTLGDDFAAVVADNVRGTELAVSHLLSLDERPVFHIAGPLNQSAQQLRRETFCRVMHEARPGVTPEVYKAKGLRAEAGYACMQKIFREHESPFSLFVCNDETAMGVMTFAREHNLRLPDDVAISCFSGDTAFSSIGVPISTVAVQSRRMGEMTARLLLDLIEHPEERDSPPVITLPVSLQSNIMDHL